MNIPVAIVGAGPAGLATAACLKRQGIQFALLDRAPAPGGSFRRMPPDMKLLSPRRFVHLPHFPYPGPAQYPGMPDYAGYLEAYAHHFELTPERAQIEVITRTVHGFELHCASGTIFSCQFVVVATGLFGHPVWPEGLYPSGGSPTILHSRDWTAEIPGHRVLIIGAGISGVAIAEQCAAAGRQVMVSRRSGRTRLIPPRWLGLDILHWFRPLEFLPRAFFGSLCRRGVHPPAYDHGYSTLVANGRITELPALTKIQGGSVQFADGTCHEVDLIVAATGYRYQTPFLPAAVRRLPGGHPLTKNCQSCDWPGLYFVGAPCARRIDSEFLRGISSDAIHVANRIRRQLRQSGGLEFYQPPE